MRVVVMIIYVLRSMLQSSSFSRPAGNTEMKSSSFKCLALIWCVAKVRGHKCTRRVDVTSREIVRYQTLSLSSIAWLCGVVGVLYVMPLAAV